MFRFSGHGGVLYRQDFPMLHILAADLLILFLFPGDEGHTTAIAPALRQLAGRSQAHRQPYKPAYPCRSLQISAFTLQLHASTQSSSEHCPMRDNYHSMQQSSQAFDIFVP